MLLISQLSFAQVRSNAPKTSLPEFGQIDEALLEMKKCPFEDNAPAMVLFDYTNTKFEVGYNGTRVTTERRMRIKVFNGNGFDHANITIPYRDRKRESRIKDLTAITYNIDESGKVVKQNIDESQIFKDKSGGNFKTVAFAFPGVKAGSVVEYRYVQIEMNRLGMDPWPIQNVIPVQTKILEVQIPTTVSIEYRKILTIPVEITDSVLKRSSRFSKPDRKLIFTAKNVKSFVPEPFMSSVPDQIQRVEFSFRRYFEVPFQDLDNWSMVNQILNASPQFGIWTKADIDSTKFVIDSAKKIPSEEEKIRFLFETVRTRIKWDGTYDFEAIDLAKVWSNRTGTSGDINLLLVNLLTKSGIYCHPVLVSTRKNGKVNKDYISLQQFNNIVVWIPNIHQPFFLDATRKHLSYKVTPSEILNRNAFAMDSTTGQWVYITDNRLLYKQTINVISTLDTSEKLTGEAAVFLYDYAKEEELNSRDKGREDEMLESTNELVITDVSEKDADDPLKPLMRKFKFNYLVTRTGDMYHFNPIFLSSLTTNPFIADTRQTDVDMGPNRQMTMTVIVNLPPNLRLDFVPGNIVLRNADSTISLQRINSVEPSRIVVKIVLVIEQTIFTREEYPVLRDFYKKLFELLNEQIVLRKVE